MTQRARPGEDPGRAEAGYRALQRITVAVRSRVDLRRVLDQLVADAGRFLDLSLCALARWDESGSFLVFSHEYRRAAGSGSPVTLEGRRYLPGRDEAVALEGLLFREQRALIHPSHPGGSDKELAATLFPELAGTAHVVMPVTADHQPVAILLAARPLALPAWTESEVEFLRAAGCLVAVAAQHAALSSQLRVLSASAAAIKSRLGMKELLRRLTEAAMMVTQSTLGLCALREGEEMVCRELRRLGRWEATDIRFVRDRGMAGWTWSNRAACVSNDARGDPRADPSLVRELGVTSALTVPILDVDGEVIGVLELHNRAAGVAYGDQEIQLASVLAHYAALALASSHHPL